MLHLLIIYDSIMYELHKYHSLYVNLVKETFLKAIALVVLEVLDFTGALCLLKD